MVFEELGRMDDPPSLRALARGIGVSGPRVLDLRDGAHGTPTLDEFCDLCSLVGLDPVETLHEAMRRVGLG